MPIGPRQPSANSAAIATLRKHNEDHQAEARKAMHMADKIAALLAEQQMAARLVQASFRLGAMDVQCPGCGREQPLPEGPEDYSIDSEGRVFPDFVCMDRSAGRYCQFAGPIQIECTD